MLTFAIPAYKRPNEVRLAVESIASQIIEEKAESRIFLSEHSDDEETWDVLRHLEKKYDFLEVQKLKRERGHDYANNFQETFSKAKGDWIWTFGNDDVLLPGALKTAIGLTKLPVDFIHLAELSRTDNSNGLIRGTLLEICSRLGWLDMTGFISCNIIRGESLNRAASLPSWGYFSKNSFVHSCAFLEALHDRPSAFVDIPLVNPQTTSQAPETVAMWNEHNVATRYFYVDEALQDMADRGILKLPLDNVFFRYHSYFLWDRLMSNMIGDFATFPDKPHVELWKHIEGLAKLLSEDQQTILMNRIKEIRDVMDNSFQAMCVVGKWALVLEELNKQHNTERFGWTYTGKPQVYS